MPRPTRVADLAGGQSSRGAPFCAFVLAYRRAVLIGVGVAPGAIQRFVPRPGFLISASGGLVVGWGAIDPTHDQPLGSMIGERRNRHVVGGGRGGGGPGNSSTTSPHPPAGCAAVYPRPSATSRPRCRCAGSTMARTDDRHRRRTSASSCNTFRP